MAEKCQAKHEITWDSGHVRSMGPCDGVAAWQFDEEAGEILPATHLLVCDAFRTQVGKSVLKDGADGILPYTFTALVPITEGVSA